MTARDFAGATVVETTNRNSPGTYDVRIRHTRTGSIKFRAVADADRARTYCAILHERIVTCSGFAPAVKDIYDGTIVHSLAEATARKLAAEINASLRAPR